MSGYRDFQCPGSHDLENSDLPMADIPMTTPRVGTSLLAPEAYLPRSFCRSDGCRPFGKFEWDPTVTGSLSSFSSANSCILSFAARVFLNVVPPELSRPNPQGILSFLSCHQKHCRKYGHIDGGSNEYRPMVISYIFIICFYIVDFI
jgi:hypothetical protein